MTTFRDMTIRELLDCLEKDFGLLKDGDHVNVLYRRTLLEVVQRLRELIGKPPRKASQAELKAICDAMTSHYGARFFHDSDQWTKAGNTDYFMTIDDVIIRDNFVSDGPGFCGSIAWVQFGGGPEYCCILSKPDEAPEGVHAWTWNIVTLDA